MAILQRADGIQFAIRCYRETLSLSSVRVFRHAAFLLSDEHGYFVRFLASKAARTVEGIFSTDAGYLLAELIWNHFEKPANLIYCEKLAEDQYLTVIVRDSLIYTDGNLNGAELAEEIAFAGHTMQTAVIFLYGDIPGLTPNSNAVQEAKDSSSLPFVTFNARNVNTLSTSLFNQIQPIEAYLLVPVQQALSDLQLSAASKQKKLVMLIFFGIVLICAVIYFLMDLTSRKQEALRLQQATNQAQVDPLLGFKLGLATPSPKDYLEAITQCIDVLTSIPGWTFGAVTVSTGGISAEIISYGGGDESLLSWAKGHHAGVALGVGKATISLTLPPLKNRQAPVRPLSMLKLVAQLVDGVNLLVPNKEQAALLLESVSSKGVYQTREATINFTNFNSNQLVLVGSFLSLFPVTINSVSLHGGQNMLVSGKVNLTLYGA